MKIEDNPYVSLSKTLSLNDLPEYHRQKEIYMGRRGYEYCESCLARLLEASRVYMDSTGRMFCGFDCKKDFDKGILTPKMPK